MSVQETEAPDRDETALVCPRCGAPAEADQLLCVACGERIALAWRKPPTWRLPAGIVAAVVLAAGAALALGLAEIADDAERVASAPVPAAPAEPTPTPAAPAPAPSGDAQTETEAPAPAPEPDEAAPAPAGDVETWPEGESGYTVILVSADERAAAERRAKAAADAGIPAGILRSDDYSSLNPGYWVVYAGRFESSEEAQKEAEQYASQGFPGGYPRFVNGGG